MTLSESAKLVAIAAAAFPTSQDRDMEPTARAWHLVLGHLPYAVAQAALVQVLATSRFWPAPAEMLEAAGKLQEPDRLTAAEAWELVARALPQVRHYDRWSVGDNGETVIMPASDPDVPRLIARTVAALGGWRELTASGELGILRAQFLRLYDGLAERGRQDALMPPVVKVLAAGLADRLMPPRDGQS